MLFSNIVLAIPGVPHQFFGTVSINGNPAPDGTSVVAKIKGIQVASTTSYEGKYGYEPIFFVDDPNSVRAGEEIKFFVNGVDTGEIAIFCNSCRDRVDLGITVSGTTPSGGGGGGGGGAPPAQPCELNGVCDPWETHETCPSDCPEGATTTTTTQQTTGCQERWVCSDWGRCVDGIRTRTCVDSNECGTINNKPLDSDPCSTEEIEESQSVLGVFSGMAVALMENSLYIIVAVVIIAVVLFLVLRRKKVTKK